MIATTSHQECTVLSGFGRPFGLNVDKTNNLYVTDMDYHAVVKLSPDLKAVQYLNPTLGQWQSSLDKTNYFNGPHSIEFDSNNHMYITTYYTPLVYVFNQAGSLLKVIGDDKSSYPLAGPATAFINEDQLYVSEYANNAIVCYTLDGEFIKNFTGFDRPHMIKPGPDGYLYCADTWNHCIKKLNFTGEVVLTWSLPIQSQPFTPVSVNFSGQCVIVADWANHQIVVFSLEGELVKIIDSLGLKRPYDALFYQGKLVVADSHHARVLITEVEL